MWYAVQGQRAGRERMAALLLEHGANANATGEHGWPPLHMAAQWNHPESAEILLQYGADIWCTDIEGLTPLDIARKYDTAAMIEMLSPLTPSTR